MENFKDLNVKRLTEKEITSTNGGILINVFLWGVAYGYVKEKFNSGQW